MRAPTRWITVALALGVATALHAASVEVHVTVLNQDGSPAPNGAVLVDGDGITIGTRGAFTVTCSELSPGDHLVSYEGGNGLVALRKVHVPERAAEAEVAMRLSEEVVVRGRVTAGVPHRLVPYARVRIEAADPADPVYPHLVVAAADGTFTLDGLAFAGDRLKVFPDGYRPSQEVQVQPPYPMQVELYCPPEAVVTGRVLDEHGWPVVHAGVVYVTAGYAGSSWTDGQGRFEHRSLRPGPYRFTAGAKYYVSTGVSIDLQEGQHVPDVTLRLQPTPRVTVRGRVVGPDGVTGIPGATVSFEDFVTPQGLDGKPVHAWRGGLPDPVYAATAGAGGRLSLALPRSEEQPRHALWFPEVRAEGYVARRYTMSGDADVPAPITLQLFRGGRLLVTLSGPTEGLTAELTTPFDPLPPLTESRGSSSVPGEYVAEAGQFRFGPVVPGEHWLALRRRGNLVAQQQVTVKEGEEMTLTLSPPPS